MRTRVKICGVTSIADALMCAGMGADAIGLNFYPKSPRFLRLDAARLIRECLPPFVATVALFVNAERIEVERILRELRPSFLQFHGEETPAFCGSFGVPYIKVCRMGPGVDLLEYLRPFNAAAAWLADAFVAQFGGAGQEFDWTLLPSDLPRPLILSGGLTPGNAGEAVRRVRPWAVDVCSGVESAKGIKDPAKIASFIAKVRDADG